MDNQEQITDFILAEKKMTANYDTFASECVNGALRADFLSMLNQGHQAQADLFQLAQSKGWYQVEQAPESKINTAYQKFSNQRPR
ncbi:spore coat protein [Pseudoflavonifractor sp. 524-17]|uniref:spore coat protein n=1 Tax=Pseudoflavonifractor sp. 524-17 TaxID=2304577 RepID=UPI00137AD20E|nr:spore coat protein [Pseudoflavonifractor sp. 524-17]NCE64259.1 spore coat protein [Pseudoflavonifractor sp. 524-17]